MLSLCKLRNPPKHTISVETNSLIGLFVAVLYLLFFPLLAFLCSHLNIPCAQKMESYLTYCKFFSYSDASGLGLLGFSSHDSP